MPPSKKVKAVIKLQLKGGQASPAPPVGPILSQHKVNMMEFVKQYNERTADKPGMVVPVEITVFSDSSFTFITKSAPTSDLIKQKLGIEKGSSNPSTSIVAEITREQLRDIAEQKMSDTNALDVEGAMNIIAGVAKNMGIKVSE